MFYTGLSNLGLFELVHNLAMPLIRRKWIGSSKSYEIKRKFKKLPNRLRAKPKLCSQDEMLLALMKIKLGLLEQDLASRFEISISAVSRIFVTWVKGLSSVLKHCLSQSREV